MHLKSSWLWWATRTLFLTIQTGPKPRTSLNVTENSTAVARAIRKVSSPRRLRQLKMSSRINLLALIFTADEEVGLLWG